jgi:hypothetical protein
VGKNFLFSKEFKLAMGPIGLLSDSTRDYFHGDKVAGGEKLTTDLQLVPRSRNVIYISNFPKVFFALLLS